MRARADASSRLYSRLPGLMLVAAVALFLGLAAPQLDLPGLHNDEAQEAGLPAMQIVRGQPIETFRGVGVTLGHRTYPLMVQDYIGALNVYLAACFVAALGPTAIALRVMTLGIGVLTLLLTFAAVAESVHPWAGALGALLLASNPSFVFWQRQGVYVTSITAALWLSALWLGARWSKRGGWPLAAALGFLCGLGIYAKLLFVWVVGGFAVAIALINAAAWVRSGIRRPVSVTHSAGFSRRIWPRVPTTGELLAASFGGLVGLLPLLAYNLLSGGTLLSIGANLTTSYYGVSNLDVFANLATRLEQFRAVLAGRDHFWYLGDSFGNPYTEWALLAAGLGLLALGFREDAQPASGWLYPLALAFAFLQTGFTVSGLFPTHFAILMPLPAIVLGVGLAQFARAATQKARLARALGRALAAGVVALLLGRDLWVNLNYQRALAQSGGLGIHSDAIYRLAAFLASNQEAVPLVAVDWGFAPQVKYLSAGESAPVEVFGYSWEPDPDFRTRVEGFLGDSQTWYIFHWPQETIFPRREAFDALLSERGLTTQLVADLARRDGAPVFQIVRVVPQTASSHSGGPALR